MLIQSSLPSSIEASLSFVSNHGKQDLICDWMLSADTWQTCPKCDEHPQDGCRTREGRQNADESCYMIYQRTCSHLATVSTMCASSSPNFVYQRRKLQRNSDALFSAQAATNSKERGGCLSVISSEMLSVAAEKDHLGSQTEHEIGGVRALVMPTEVCNGDLLGGGNSSIPRQFYPPNLNDVPCAQCNNNRDLEFVLKSEFIPRCLVGAEYGSDEAPNNNLCKTVLEYNSLNDSCSSSKSNMELGSAARKIEVDDTGEFSSSDILALEMSGEDLSEKDLCISILRNHGLLEGICPLRTCASAEILGTSSDNNCFGSCKVCGHFETTLNMLICDNCEEAFHVSCCNPRIKKIPIDEWFCQRCLKKKRKLSLETTNGKSPKIRSEMSEYRNGTSKGELGAIVKMLEDTEPYTTGVRIGKAFQAEVPEWSGPISNDIDCIGEPLDMDPAEYVDLRGWNSNMSSTPSSIGNWLQCQEVLYDDTGEGVDGTICGKWRRAPLFEVQTDDWDCSCSVLWDPVHSDCAVPQELETEQVLIHLKYIELLKPRLAAKRQKLSRTKSDGSDNSEDVRTVNIKTWR